MIPFSYPSPRVSQLDAHILDSELLTLFKQHLTSIFSLHNSKWWTYDSHPDLWDLLLNLLIFRLTIWKSGSSYGLSLQNLKLVNFRDGKKIRFSKKSSLFGLIILDYLYKKFESYLYSVEADTAYSTGIKSIDALKNFVIRNKDKILGKVNTTLRVLNLLNFVLFLVSGRYASLAYRMLGISMTPIVVDLLRFNGDSVNYEFQNRQLVWNVMTEFLVFILPLLQLTKLRRMAKKMLSPYKKNEIHADGANPIVTPFTSLASSQCAICHSNREKALLSGNKKSSSVSCSVTNPYITNCGHIYCYICIASKFSALEASSGDEGCLRCGLKLTWFKKYGEAEADVDKDAIMVEYEEESDEEVEDEKKPVAEKNDSSDSASDASDSSDEEEQAEEDDDSYSEGEDYVDGIGQEEFEEDDGFDPDEAFEL